MGQLWESGPAGKGRGKRRQGWTEREARRMLRAAKAEGENRILRKRPDGTLELVPMTGENNSEPPSNPWEAEKPEK